MLKFPVNHLISPITGKVSLSTVLIVPFVLQTIFAVGLVGYLSFKNGQQAINDLATRLEQETSNRIQQKLDSYLAIPHQINQINSKAIELGILDLNDLEKMGKFFHSQIKTFNVGYINYGSKEEEFIGVERLNNNKILINETKRNSTKFMSIYTTDDKGNRTGLKELTPNTPIKTEAWYADAVKAGHPIWSKIYTWSDKPDVLSISSSYPLCDRDHKCFGVIGVDLILSQMDNFLESLVFSPSSRILILERNGSLVAYSGRKTPFKVKDRKAYRIRINTINDPQIQSVSNYLDKNFGSLKKIRTSQNITVDALGERQFVHVTPWQDSFGLDWLVVVIVPEADFMEQINSRTGITFLFCCKNSGQCLTGGKNALAYQNERH